MKSIDAWIDHTLKNRDNPALLAEARDQVSDANKRFPLR
jgi:hypothetical protein